MITLKHIEIYKKYEGDADGYYRCATKDEKEIFKDGEWTMIDGLPQDLLIIKNKQAADSYKHSVDKAIFNVCTDANTIAALKELI